MSRGDECLYQIVRHPDPGFLTMSAPGRVAGSLRAPHRDRDHLAPHQANRPVDCGLLPWREPFGPPTDLAYLGPDHDDLGPGPVLEQDVEGRQEMSDPESMQAELRAGRIEVLQAKATDPADS